MHPFLHMSCNFLEISIYLFVTDWILLIGIEMHPFLNMTLRTYCLKKLLREKMSY